MWSNRHVTHCVNSPSFIHKVYSKNKKNLITKIYIYYKLGLACVIIWSSFVLLQIKAVGTKVVTNWVIQENYWSITWSNWNKENPAVSSDQLKKLQLQKRDEALL